MSKLVKFYENLTNTTSSEAFSVHLPEWDRGKNAVKMNISGFAKIFHEQIGEIL